MRREKTPIPRKLCRVTSEKHFKIDSEGNILPHLPIIEGDRHLPMVHASEWRVIADYLYKKGGWNVEQISEIILLVFNTARLDNPISRGVGYILNKRGEFTAQANIDALASAPIFTVEKTPKGIFLYTYAGQKNVFDLRVK